MARNRSHLIDAALLDAVQAHPRNLTSTVARQVGISRQAVAARARALVEAGYLARSGSTRPTYVLGPKRRVVLVYPRVGLAEDRVWREHVAPVLNDVAPNIYDIAQYGISEMVNNAVDHSEAKTVTVTVERDLDAIELRVGDDGVGVFRKIARALGLPDDRLALLELGKGKFTTNPTEHTGEGVFFTSRMFDQFQIWSGNLVFDHDGAQPDVLFDRDTPAVERGSLVVMRIALDCTRTAKAVFDEYSSGPDDYSFAKTVVPVRMARMGRENLLSRSQAKRVLRRVDQFRRVVLDFSGIDSIGQAFADEVFRVFANAHPGVELVSIHAAPEVQQMIRRAQVVSTHDDAQSSLF